jgi:probable phosphoglycerate mutase
VTTTPLGGRRFVLLRHGQTDWNAEGRMQGTYDLSRLTPLGLDQAIGAGAALGRLLGDTPIKAVFASPLSRAQRTLELAVAEWPAAAAAVGGQTILDDLKEVELLEWSGRLSLDVKREDPGRYRCAARERFTRELPRRPALPDAQCEPLLSEPPKLDGRRDRGGGCGVCES